MFTGSAGPEPTAPAATATTAATAPASGAPDSLANAVAQQTAAFSQGVATHLNGADGVAEAPLEARRIGGGIGRGGMSPSQATAALAAATEPHDAVPVAATQHGAGPVGVVSAEPRAVAAMGAMAAPDGSEPGAATPAALLGLLRQRALQHPEQPAYALALQLIETAETGKPGDPAVISQLSAAGRRGRAWPTARRR
jgi:hypothetical protein